MNIKDSDILKEEISLFDVETKKIKSTINKSEKIIELPSKQDLYDKILNVIKNHQEKRAITLRILKEEIDIFQNDAKKAFFKNEITAMEVMNANCLFMDNLIQTILKLANNVFINDKIKPNDMCIVAVGGYGRKELAPYSDIDLLFIVPENFLKIHEKTTEFILYMLWDLNIKVGQAFRTISQCIIDSKKDNIILTNLLESRYITGSQRLFNEFVVEYRKKLVKGFEKDFVAAKLKERNNRYSKHKKSRYLLEPDVKEGLGGLRDLHLIFWFAKFLYNVNDIKELVNLNVISSHAAKTFINAHGFLSAVRCYIHFVTKRPSNTLIFDIQPEIARLMGYVDTNNSIAVEKFMKAYYLSVKSVGNLVRIICSLLEEINCSEIKSIKDKNLTGKDTINGFNIINNRLDFNKDISKEVIEIIKIFRVAQKYNLDIHPKAIQKINENLSKIESLEKNDDANKYFLEILISKSNPERILRLMSEAGVLGRFITDFGFITAQMQYDMYHIYTTDEHSLMAVGILHFLMRGKEVKLKEYSNLPNLEFLKKVAKKIYQEKVLFLAMLTHDIGKGRGKDHCEIGSEISKNIAKRFALSENEINNISWLVLEHQTMSQTAFQRDINDEKTIKDFAKKVKSTNKLNMLYLLTCADILAVGPNVWSEWKSSLLKDLYQKTFKLLTGQIDDFKSEAKASEIKKHLKEYLSKTTNNNKINEILSLGNDRYYLTYPLQTLKKHSLLLEKDINVKEPIYFDFAQNNEHNNTVITVYTKDKTGVFSKIAGALSLSGLSIIDAKIVTLENGFVLDSFSVCKTYLGKSSPITLENEITKIKTNIRNTVFDKINVKEQLNKKLSYSIKRARNKHNETEVIFNNEASDEYTLIEISSNDKIGALYSITNEMSNSNLQINSAHISTYGNRVFDVFYVKNKDGKKILSDKKNKQISSLIKKALE